MSKVMFVCGEFDEVIKVIREYRDLIGLMDSSEYKPEKEIVKPEKSVNRFCLGCGEYLSLDDLVSEYNIIDGNDVVSAVYHQDCVPPAEDIRNFRHIRNCKASELDNVVAYVNVNISDKANAILNIIKNADKPIGFSEITKLQNEYKSTSMIHSVIKTLLVSGQIKHVGNKYIYSGD